MAYILVGNTTVSDPNNEMPYITAQGLAPYEVSVFMRNMEELGYSVSASEFQALNRFVINLKDAGVWPKVREVYPFMGDSAETARVKLKYKNSNILTPINGVDASYFEYSQDGKVLGKKEQLRDSKDSRPGLLTGFTVGELNEQWSLTSLQGEVPRNPNNQFSPLFGASENSAASISVEFSFTYTSTNAKIAFENSTGYGQPLVDRGNITHPAGIVHADAVGRYLTAYQDNVQFYSQPRALPTTEAPDAELGLFTRTAYGSSSINGSFQGAARFVVLAEGGLGVYERAALHDEISVLAESLGKTFT